MSISGQNLTDTNITRYHRDNQNPYIKEQTTQWPKEKGQITIYKPYT
jgi:hypothetical protein